MEYLDDLNARQREAVLHTEGPLLIVAGAGAGKTRVITHRILHLIKTGAPPESILAITFTNKAAKEMLTRVQELLSRNERGYNDAPLATNRYTLNAKRFPFISTFHALGVHILREQFRELGIPKHFTIFDRGDSLSAIKTAMKETDMDPKSFDPSKILSAISREKGNMVTLEKFGEQSEREYYPRIIAQIWNQYEKILAREKAYDFDDLLLKTALLLARNERVRERYQRQWQFIHIDEYQDTNRAQYEIARLLAEQSKNIAVVGDGDQNIYSWRGATIKNILNFEKDYPTAKVVLLEENYRSTQRILAVANHVIAKNKQRLEKTLFTKNQEGEKVGLYSAYDEADEARFVSQKAKQLIESGIPPREIAVLFRANFQSRVLEEAFLTEELPYQVLGTRFFERREVKDMISYTRAALDSESLSDIKRIINVPPRGIGKVTLLKIFSGQEEKLPAGVRNKIIQFRKTLAEMKRALEEKKLSEALKFILSASGIEAELKKGSEDDQERLENVRELVTFALRYDGLPPEEAVSRFLTDAALASDQDELKEEKDAVRLMTVHASKGLEFSRVFVTGMEQDLFPHSRIGSDERISDDKVEEERRLFYVALTRAKNKIYLSYASIRTIFGSRQVNLPSEFILDIEDEHLETEQAFEGGGKIIYLE